MAGVGGLTMMHVTSRAAERIGHIQKNQKDPKPYLRVAIQGGGCSGFQYHFALEANPQEGDQLVEEAGAQVLIDPMSLMYLQGATLDFVSDLKGAFFKINNPNAGTTCSCGASFGLPEDA